MVDRLRGRSENDAGSEQERRVAVVLYRRSLHVSTAEFLEQLLRQLPPSEPLEPATLGRITYELRGGYGQEADRIGDELGDYDAHLSFWRQLSERFPDDPYAMACHADTLLLGGHQHEAFELFLAAVEREPALHHEFSDDLFAVARELGDEAMFLYSVAVLEAQVTLIERQEFERHVDADDVRELYSELLEEHAAYPTRLERLQEIGQKIGILTQAGTLPQAIVRRGGSRK